MPIRWAGPDSGMLDYWSGLTQASQVAIIVAIISGGASIVSAAIKHHFKWGIRFLITGIIGFIGLVGLDWFLFDPAESSEKSTGRSKAPLFKKVDKEDKIKPNRKNP